LCKACGWWTKVKVFAALIAVAVLQRKHDADTERGGHLRHHDEEKELPEQPTHSSLLDELVT
jgi:hypothetical protein